jgi:hypothetical protein
MLSEVERDDDLAGVGLSDGGQKKLGRDIEDVSRVIDPLGEDEGVAEKKRRRIWRGKR